MMTVGGIRFTAFVSARWLLLCAVIVGSAVLLPGMALATAGPGPAISMSTSALEVTICEGSPVTLYAAGIDYDFNTDHGYECGDYDFGEGTITTWSLAGSCSGSSWGILGTCWTQCMLSIPLSDCYITITGLAVGNHTITATADDVRSACTNEDWDDPLSATATFVVHVKPDPDKICPSTAVSEDNCGSGGGGGCGSCGSGGSGSCPSPSLLDHGTVHQPLPIPAGLEGPNRFWTNNSSDPSTCGNGKVTVFDTCYGPYACITGCSGQSESISLNGGSSITLGDGTQVAWTVGEGGNTTFQFYYGNKAQAHYSLDAPSTIDYQIESGPDWVKTADEVENNETGTTFDYDYSATVYRAQTSNGEVWDYTHESGGTKVTQVKRTDVASPYVDIAYVESGNGIGKPSTVIVRDPSGNETSRTTYDYNAQGQVASCTKGIGEVNQWQTEYAYDPNERTVTVTQQSCDQTPVVYSTTEYHYGEIGVLGLEDDDPNHDVTEPGQYVTWVTRKDPANSANDQRTVYIYNNNGSERGVLLSVTDPFGTKTTYTRDVNHPERVTQVEVSHLGTQLRKTEYSYDAPNGFPLNPYHPLFAVYHWYHNGTTWQEAGTETNNYYEISSQPTAWLKTHKDVRGNYTHYDRVDGKPWQISEVRVCGTKHIYNGNVLCYEPTTEAEWNTFTPIKTHAYYTVSDSEVTSGHAKIGQLKEERVPSVDTTQTPVVDQVTTYRYWDSTNEEILTAPTETEYQYWNGSAYETKTSYTTYDALGRIISTTDADSRTISHAYDSVGRPTTTTYAQGVYTETHYLECCGLVDWSRDENGNKTYYVYDDMKRVIGVSTDIQVRAWPGVELDQYGQVTNWDECPETYWLVKYTYDCFGNKSSVVTLSDSSTDRTTDYTYDKLNRVVQIDYPTEGANQLLASEYFQYDSLGNLKAKLVGSVNPATHVITSGSVTAYQYDGHNRLAFVEYEYPVTLDTTEWPLADFTLTSGDVSYGYDEYRYWDQYYQSDVQPHGTLKTSMTDSTGTSYYAYDELGRLTRYVPSIKNTGQNVEYVVAYTYNSLGEKASVKIGTPGTEPDINDPFYYVYDWDYLWITLPLATESYNVSYDYFANGWLKNVNNGVNAVAEYSYDEVGNRERVDLGDDTYTTYSYDTDPRYRLNSIAHYKDGTPATELATIGYTSTTRDAVGNPKSMTDWTGTWNYSYDSNNRLIGAIAPNPIPGQPGGTSENYGGVPYDYDWVGNRIHPPGEPNPMVYNSADQLTTWPGIRTYTYDDAGNLTTVKDASGQTTVASYTYTPSGLLNVATYHDKTGTERTLTNTWDANSNRVGMSANGNAYSFVYDPTAGIPAVLEESTSSATVCYIREPGGSLMARLHPTDGIGYYHFDELGSTRLVTDSDGDVTDRYSYDAYGSLLAHETYTGSVDQPYHYVGQLGYYTHCMEPDFGLLQLGVRFYDAEVGGFTQRDEMQDGLNWYIYAVGQPTEGVDPSGSWCVNYGPLGCVGTTCGGNPQCKPRGKPRPVPTPDISDPASIFYPGLMTGAAAVGSACTLGLWDGGCWSQEPGFGGAKTCAYVGVGSLCAAGGVYAAEVCTGWTCQLWWPYQNAGGAGLVMILNNGKVVWRLDCHPYGKTPIPFWEWPHIDWPGHCKHWPWR